MPTSGNEKLIDLLTQLLRVQAIQVAGSRSITEGARLLKLAGLDNQTIAEVLNTSPATIRTLTANLRSGLSGSGRQGARGGRRGGGAGRRRRRASPRGGASRRVRRQS